LPLRHQKIPTQPVAPIFRENVAMTVINARRFNVALDAECTQQILSRFLIIEHQRSYNVQADGVGMGREFTDKGIAKSGAFEPLEGHAGHAQAENGGEKCDDGQLVVDGRISKETHLTFP
jgi:hypothetical protein